MDSLASDAGDERPAGYGFRYRLTLQARLMDPAEYAGQESIAVVCTQLSDSKEQARLVKAWAKALPTMSGIKRLDFRTHFPRGLFDAVCSVPNLEELHLKWSNLRSIGPIVRLKKVQAFHLGSSPSVADPETVRELASLRCLSFENIRALYDLDWLAEMPQLEQLNLCGGMDSTQRLASLRPLAKLPNLRRLQLDGARVTDKSSLMVLAEIPSLEAVDTAWYWPEGALREFAKARPDVWVNGQRWPDWQDVHERQTQLIVHESMESLREAARERFGL